ncbi:MAG TPA: hypothetical protein H9890_00535 [Candidatus Faecalibacterium intestinigallinarum]|uniref:Uncharacterized protein n=1 Tax=Candidatus Faecalibacterium intestinigallinarum TaxID=2838581 RepID=A0A9D1TV44_9FIRM|nr:hypothetical protein [Candidatus Faecalibacterium intestinigallinarum]
MHTTRLQKFLSILANLAIVGMELRAIPLSWDGVHAQMFLFYTELSNLFAMGVCFVTALCQLRALLTGGEMPAWVRTLKYTVTCCLMLTFLTVVFVLAPMYGPDGHYVMLLTSSMLYNHFLNPVTALLSFVLLERVPALPRRAVGRAMIPTLVYGGIMLAANIAKVYKGPYPFLYVYEQPLWTSCMWVVVILGGALLIAWAVWKLGGGRAA